MSETYKLVSGADPEASLYDGISLYEDGEAYKALSCWRDLLTQIPDHEIAQHYIKFVQGYLGINADAGEREINAASLRESQRLRGEPEAASPHEKTAYYSDEDVAQVDQAEETISAPTRSQIMSRSLSKTAIGGLTPDSVPADAVSTPHLMTPAAVIDRSAAEINSSRSEIAQNALEGPSGPRTQADGLTIQSLSRQLASLHRSGKYEEAVEIAKQLLSQDQQHQVARRYIDEYHRQKQVALQHRKRTETTPNEEGSDSSSSSSSNSSSSSARNSSSRPTAPVSAAREPEVGETHLGSPIATKNVSAVEFNNDISDIPTSAPLNASMSEPKTSPGATPDARPTAVISDLDARPKVKMRPDQISWQEFDHRAGFFTSQVDGQTSYEELIMISGMPREQALKILAELVSSGVIG